MRKLVSILIPGVVTLAASMAAAAAEKPCDPLQEYVGSVAPGETRELKFHVIVGGNFKDREGAAYGARRCDFGGYQPGEALCQYFMEHGSIESPGYNAKAIITCLSPKTRFPAGTWLYAISFAAKVGTETRGSRVDLVLAEDKEVGGVSLSIKTTGY